MVDVFRLDMYKLQSDLAERVASLREDLAKVYMGTVSAIIGAGVVLHRFYDPSELYVFLPMLGAAVSVSWLLSILSITARLAAKHKVLLELEKDLPFRFFEKEGSAFGCSLFRRQVTSAAMPVMFLSVCLYWLSTIH